MARRIDEHANQWEVAGCIVEPINRDATCDGVVYVEYRSATLGTVSEWPARCPGLHPHRGERRMIREIRREKPGHPSSLVIEERTRIDVIEGHMGRKLISPDELLGRLRKRDADRQLELESNQGVGKEGAEVCRRAIATSRARTGKRGSDDLVATKDIAEDLDDLIGAL